MKITQTNPKLAKIIISQFGGPDGELAASMRYLSQRYTMPYKEVTGILTDIGTERTCPYGDDLCNYLSADKEFVTGRN